MRRASLGRLLAVATLAAALGLAGCGSNGSGFGVDLNLTLDPSVSDTTAATIATVQVQITGAASDALTLPGAALASRQTSVSYAPKATSGTLTFDASAVDGSGATVASGQANVTLKSGKTVAVTLTLAAAGGGDMGACSGVSACTAGDGCCPSGCDATTDSDCQPTCGNGAIEGNEVCDDGNTMNGDGCDVTCKYTNAVTILSGHPGGPGWVDGKTDKARYAEPRGIVSDGTFIYDVDRDGTVRKTDPATGMVTTLAGSPNASATLPLQDGVGTAAVFSSNPSDIELLGGALYVSDGGAGFGRFALRKIDLATGAVTSGLASFPAPGFLSFAHLTGLATDGTLLYILYDSSSLFGGGGTLLFSYNPSNGALTQINASAIGFQGNDLQVQGGVAYLTGVPNAGFGPPPGPAAVYKVTPLTTAGVASALGTVTSNGFSMTSNASTLWIGEAGGIFTVTGLTTTPTKSSAPVAGTGTPGYLDATPASAAQFNNVSGMQIVGGAVMYIADRFNHAIRAWTGSSNAVSTVAGAAPSLAPSYGTTSAYPVLAPPGGLVSDGTSLWLAQPNQPIRKITIADGSSAAVGAATQASSITLLGANLYGTFNDGTIHQIPTSGAADSVYAGTAGSPQQPASDGCRAAAACSGALATLSPVSITTDGTDLYFVDSNKLIRKIATASGAVTTLAGTPGSADIVDDVGDQAHFGAPRGLVFTNGALYTLDGDANGGAVVIRRIELATGKVTTIAGQPGGAGAVDGIGAAARFSALGDLTTDGTSLFVTDATPVFNSFGDKTVPAIRQVVLATGAVSTMIGKRNQWGTIPGTGTDAVINDPAAITYDTTNHVLFFFDTAEGVVERIK